MINLIENGQLATDLDAKTFSIVNLGAILPMPPNLAPSDDPRLSDARAPLDGSVTDASVAAGAGIAQSKLSLDGDIPSAWLGNSSTTAAAGNVAEYVANKGMPNGYASLDGSGRVPLSQIPGGVGLGTITSIGLTMPVEFQVSGSPITSGAGTFSVVWNTTIPNLSWFGNNSGAPSIPQFYTTPIPNALIPPLGANQVVSGQFNPVLIPVFLYGAGSHAGAAPDPGSSGNPTDYLARNGSYVAVPTLGPPYQPQLPAPTLTYSGSGSNRQVIVANTVAGVTSFYSVSGAGGPYQEVPSVGYFPLPAGQSWVYSSRPGYANSPIALSP